VYIKKISKIRIANAKNIKVEIQQLRVQTLFFIFFRRFPSPLSL
jgi:hypothetical protein